MAKEIVIVSHGTGEDAGISRSLFNGSGGLRDYIICFDGSVKELNVTDVEETLRSACCLLISPCSQSSIKDSRVQSFERELLKRAVQLNKPWGMATRTLTHAVAPQFSNAGKQPRFIILEGEARDDAGALTDVFPHAVRLELLSIWGVPKILGNVFALVEKERV